MTSKTSILWSFFVRNNNAPSIKKEVFFSKIVFSGVLRTTVFSLNNFNGVEKMGRNYILIAFLCNVCRN